MHVSFIQPPTHPPLPPPGPLHLSLQHSSSFSGLLLPNHQTQPPLLVPSSVEKDGGGKATVGGWVGGWVGRWVDRKREEEEAVRMRCCGSCIHPPTHPPTHPPNP